MAISERTRFNAALDELLAVAAEGELEMDPDGPLGVLQDDATELFDSAGLDREVVTSLARLDDGTKRKQNRDTADLDAVVAVSRTAFATGVVVGWRAARREQGDRQRR